MANYTVTLTSPLNNGDTLTVVVKVPAVIANLQAALNATPKGGTLDAHGQVFKAVQLTIPAGVTLANAEFDYSGSSATQQSDFIDLAQGAALINVTERAAS